MNDQLKHFMEENREAFDTEMPSPDLWGKIDQNLPSNRRKIRPILWQIGKIAALIILVFGLGIYAGVYLEQERTVASKLEEHAEYEELEAYYSRQVNQKVKAIKATKADISKELAELETAFNEWKMELGEDATQEEILNIMVRNYQFCLLYTSPSPRDS